MAQKETILIELDFDVSDFTKSAAKLNGEIDKLNKQQKELKKSGDINSITYQENTQALKANKKELAETNKTISNLTTANKANAGSNEQLKAQLSLQTAEYNKLSKEQKKSTERGKELKTGISQITEELKGNEEEVGDNRRSVGDYGKALGATPFGSFIGGIKAMGAAFIANPIGIIIAGIIGGLALLKKAFTASEDGENKLAKATAILSTIFDRLLDLLGPLADFIANTLGKVLEDIGKQVEVVARGIESALKFLGFEDAAKSLGNYIDQTDRALKGAAEVADARAKADIIERDLLVERSVVEGKIAKLRLIAKKEQTVSAADRKKALIEAGELQDSLLVKEQEVLKLRFEAQKQENTFAKSNKENLDKEAAAEAALNNNIAARANQQRTIQRELNTVTVQLRAANNKAAAEKRKQVSDAIKQQKLELTLFIASQGKRAKTLEEELALAESISIEKEAILKKELDAKIISETQFQISLLAIKEEFLNAQTNLTIDNANRELAEILDSNQTKLDNNQFLNDELFQQEKDRLELTAQARKDFEAAQLEAGEISQTQFNDSINAINAENIQANKDLAAEKAAADKEQSLVDLETQREIDLLNREDEFELRQQDLDRQKEQELLNAETTGADTEKIQQKFDLLERKLDKAKFDSKIAIASDTFSNLATLAGRESKAGKAFAIAQTTIDTFKAAQSAFSAMAGIPFVGPVLGGIAAAAAIKTGFSNIQQIRSTSTPKLAKGGIFGGNLHSNGGVQLSADGVPFAEAEKDEAFVILNRNSTAMLNQLSDLNVAGGGVNFSNGRVGGGNYQDGGIALTGISGNVESELNTNQQLVAAIESMPAPVVVVQDINEVQGATATVADRAII